MAAGLSRRWLPAACVLLAIVVLGAQNLWMLGPHYLEGMVVPWDFLGSYHAVPFFWIEALRDGASPAWVHLQAMGYPLYLHPQSGFYYPGFWWFVAANQTYDFHAAVVMQDLHILLGGIGAAVCARLSGMRWTSALLAGVAYQAFGAFASNASHPDIVRGHALAPWLLGPVLAEWRRGPLFDLSVAALPLWVYALWTGGYAGIAIAVSFTAGLLLVARMAVATQPERRAGAWIFAAMLAGLLLAGLMLWPTLADRMEIDRAQTWDRLVHEYAQWADLLGLVIRIDDNDVLPHDMTMRSLSLGLPIVALLAARPLAGRLRWALWPACMVIVAIAMGAGLVHRTLSAVLPPLAYSRFPFSDYRGLFGLGVVLLAAQAWDLAAAQTSRRLGAWLTVTAVVAALSIAALALAYPGVPWLDGAPQRLIFGAGGAVLLVGLALVLPRARAAWMSLLLLPVALWLTVQEWDRIHVGGHYLFSSDAAIVAERPFHGFDEARRRVREVLKWPPECRPARVLVPEGELAQVPWRGYYTGEFMSHDYSGPLKFTRQQVILNSIPLARFGLLPWTARIDDGDAHPAPPDLQRMAPAPIRCTYYSTTEVHYQVDLPHETRVVENEVYWRGWSAILPQGTIEAGSLWGFRAWTLPAGRYQMVAVFRPPHRKAARLVFAAGAAAWAVMLLFQWRTRRRRDSASTLL